MRFTHRRTWAMVVGLAVAVIGLGATAVAASDNNDLGSRPVFLVRSDNTVDASVAGAAAARAGAPLLYSSPAALDASTRDFMIKYQPTKVVLVGGSKALSETVEASVMTLGYTPMRVLGGDRAETAVKLGELVADLPPAQGPKGDPGPAGPQGPSGSSGSTGASPPRIRDSSGAVLGVLLGSNNGFNNVLTSTGYQIEASFDTPVPRDDARNGLYYTGSSCTGTAWMDAGFPGIVYRTNIDVRYSSSIGAWLQNKAMSQASLTAQSQWVYNSVSDSSSCQTSSHSSTTGFEMVVRTSATVGVPNSISYPLAIIQ